MTERNEPRRSPPAAPSPDLTAALRLLREAGRRAQHLDDDTIARIAGAAARERRRLQAAALAPAAGKEEADTVPAVVEIEHLAESGHSVSLRRRSPGRRWLIIAAAAVAGILAAGSQGALPAPIQDVMADSASIVDLHLPRHDTALVSDRQTPAPELGGPQLPPPATGRSGGDGSSATTAVDVSAGAATSAPSPPTVASDQPAASTTTGAQSPTTAVTPSTSPASDPAAVDAASFPVGEAGRVVLRFAASEPTAVSIEDNPGWRHEVTAETAGHLEVGFSGGGYEAAFSVLSSPTSFHLVVDPGPGAPPPAISRTRTYDLGPAGIVVISYDTVTVTAIRIDLQPGWRYDVAADAPDHLAIRLSGPGLGSFRASVTTPSIGLDLSAGS